MGLSVRMSAGIAERIAAKKPATLFVALSFSLLVHVAASWVLVGDAEELRKGSHFRVLISSADAVTVSAKGLTGPIPATDSRTRPGVSDQERTHHGCVANGCSVLAVPDVPLRPVIRAFYNASELSELPEAIGEILIDPPGGFSPEIAGTGKVLLMLDEQGFPMFGLVSGNGLPDHVLDQLRNAFMLVRYLPGRIGDTPVRSILEAEVVIPAL